MGTDRLSSSFQLVECASVEWCSQSMNSIVLEGMVQVTLTETFAVIESTEVLVVILYSKKIVIV